MSEKVVYHRFNGDTLGYSFLRASSQSLFINLRM